MSWFHIFSIWFPHVSSYFFEVCEIRKDGVYDITKLVCILAPFFLKPFSFFGFNCTLIEKESTNQWGQLNCKEIHCQPPWGQRQDHACGGQGHRSILAPQLENGFILLVSPYFAHPVAPCCTFFRSILSIFRCHISDWGESTSSTQAEAMLLNCWKVWELVICLSFPKTCWILFCLLCICRICPLTLNSLILQVFPFLPRIPLRQMMGAKGNGDVVWCLGV